MSDTIEFVCYLSGADDSPSSAAGVTIKKDHAKVVLIVPRSHRGFATALADWDDCALKVTVERVPAGG